MNALKDRLTKQIRSEGPISVAEYMTVCLLDPVHGYYPTRDPLGSDGDFITAPEISQMFGECIGLWALQSWIDMGRPPYLHLVELGPGRGIMMSDILRIAALDRAFEKALSVTLIEASAALEAVQAKTLGAANVPIRWAKDLRDVPKGSTLIIGNEFLDCLPIRQFIQNDPFAGRAGWHERLISVDKNDNFRFVKSPMAIAETLQSMLPEGQSEARKDDLIELCPATHQLIDQISQRLFDFPGRAMFIDYGPSETEFGDTLQAIKRHEKVGVFSDLGNTDLTARVDFSPLRQIAEQAGIDATETIAQRTLLSKLGIEMRAVALLKSKPEARPKIARQLHRLMDSEEMGELFKAVTFSSPGLNAPLGFAE